MIRLLMKYILGIVASLVVGACSVHGRQPMADAASQDAKQEGTLEGEREKIWSLAMPEIPVTITTAKEQMEYLLLHYWDKYDFTDTVPIGNRDCTEQVLVDYLSLLPQIDRQKAGKSLAKLAVQIKQEPKVQAWFDNQLEHYLYDPNSPMRNDNFYMSILEGIIASKNYDETEKIRPKYRLKMLRKNCVGMKAENFTFTLSGGNQGNLYGISSPYTLILLYDPECENCRQAIDLLAHSPLMQQLSMPQEKAAIRQLTTLSVSVEGDEEGWINHLSVLPQYWMNGYDSKSLIRDKELYDLRSFPSLYLLDKNKQVILKDVNAEQVLGYLSTNLISN